MSLRKDEKLKTITSRDLARMCSMRSQVPMAETQRVLNALIEFLEYGIVHRYKITLPNNMGKMSGIIKKGEKKGTIRKCFVPIYMTKEDLLNKTNDEIRYYEKDGDIYYERLKDVPDYLFPSMKFNKSFKDKIKKGGADNG